MRTNYFERIVGTTFKGTWVNSGATASQITSALIDRNQTVVSSITAISSLGGLYFALHQLPTSSGPYVNEWRAWVNSFQYVNRQLINAIDLRAD